MVCMKEEEDPGEKLSQDEIISRTKQVIQGLEALKQEHHSILEGLLGTLRCLKQDEEGVLVEEKSHMIRKSLEMLELGLSEAQVHWSVIRSLVCTGDQTDGGFIQTNEFKRRSSLKMLPVWNLLQFSLSYCTMNQRTNTHLN